MPSLELRRLLLRAALGANPAPPFLAVGLQRPFADVAMRLIGDGCERDVAHACSVAALRPLAFALGIDAGPECRLDVIDQVTARTVGAIRLTDRRRLPASGGGIWLYSAAGYSNCSLGPLRQRVSEAVEDRRERNARGGHGFRMEPRDRRALYVFYMLPRPVALVSVVLENRSNLFPMDLIGPMGEDTYLMALRNSSPAVELMKRSGRMALSGIPLAWAPVAYELGKHHLRDQIDLGDLPFALYKSPRFGLPVPAGALDLREVEVCEHYQAGSHTLFVTRTVTHKSLAVGLALHHVHGPFQQYLARTGRALPRLEQAP